MRSCLIAIAGFAIFQPALADEPVGECLDPETLVESQGVRPFAQTRWLEGVPRPLVSTGDMTLDSNSVVWRVTQPIEIATVISSEGMTQSIAGGPQTPVGASGAASPILSDSGLIDLIKGDLSRIHELYEVEKTSSETNWLLSLTPKAEDMSRFVGAITVEGCMKVQAIVVNQTNGDRIMVAFTDEKTGE